MPDFEITSPDGKRFIVTAPDGASQDEILAYAQKNHAEAKAPEPSNWDIFKRNLGLGTRDAIEGVGQLPGMAYDAARMPLNLGIKAINAAITPAQNLTGLVTGKQPQAPFQIPEIRSAKENLSAVGDAIGLPTAETSGEKVRSAIGQNVAGLIPTMGAGAVLQGGGRTASFIGDALTAAPASQVLGAAGAGMAGEIAKQSEWGPAGQFGASLAGGIAGASLPALGGMAARGVSSLVQPFTASGRDKIVGEALLRNSSDPETLAQRLVTGADDESRRLPGSPVTSAVAARDPQMLMLESGLRSDVQTAPGVMSPAAALRDVEAQRNANRQGAIQALMRGEADNPTARGDVVRGALDSAEGGMRARTNQLFDTARDNPNRYSNQPILARAEEVTRMFNPAQGGEGVPAALQGVIDDIANMGRLDVNQAQNIRSRLGAIAGEASMRGDNRLSSAAGAISEALEGQISDPRWMAAVAQRRAQGAALGRDATGAAASAAITRTDKFGAPMITSDAAIKKALETPQAANQVLEAGYKALDDARRARMPTAEIEALSQNVQAMRQTMRDQFADNIGTASRTTSDLADAAGNVSRQLSPAQFTRFWEKNRRIADVLFDGEERRTLDRLAADFAETSVANTARARGSDTAQNLSVGNFIARLTNGVIDPQNPLAQSLGNLGPVAGWLTRAPEQAMREMLVQAVRDPKFAAQLVEKAGPDSLQRALLYWGQTMPQRLQDTALGALAREVPRLGMSDATGTPSSRPRITGR